MTCKDGRFNTGNKLCSNDLRDLNDNSIIVDGYVNSDEDYIEDRLGVERLTLAGIESINKKQMQEIQDHADSTIGEFDGKIDAIIKEAGGIEVVSEFGDSLDKVISQKKISEHLGQDSGGNTVIKNGDDEFTLPAKGGGLALKLDGTLTLNDGKLSATASGNIVLESAYKLSDVHPVDVRHPLIEVDSKFKVMEDFKKLGNNLGVFELMFEIDNKDLFSKDKGRSHQGLVVDNQDKLMYMTSIAVDKSITDVIVIAYDFNGVEEFRTGSLKMGHGDFFAVTREEGIKYIYYYSPESVQLGKVGVIKKAELRQGVTDSQSISLLSTSDLNSNHRLEVTNYDNANLLVRGTLDYIIPIASLNNKSLEGIEYRGWQWSESTLTTTAPRQQTKSIMGNQVELTGTYLNDRFNCYVAMSDLSATYTASQELHLPNTTLNEVEGLCFLWDDASNSFRTIISVWDYSGKVKVFNVTGGIRKAGTDFSVKYEKIAGSNKVAKDTPMVLRAKSFISNTDTVDVGSTGSLKLGATGSDGVEQVLAMSTTFMYPTHDNALNLGSRNNAFKSIHLNTAPIVTSDARRKSNMKGIDDRYVRVMSKLDFKQFNTDADTDLHFGIIAQEWIAACDAEGVDPKESGILVGDEKIGYAIRYNELQILFNAYIMHKISMLQ